MTKDTEIRQFIEEYSRSRFCNVGSVRAVVNRLVSYERKYGKPFYQFTKEEILQIFKEASVISERTLQNWIIFSKHFAVWMLDYKGLPLTNEYETITKYDLIPCVNIDKKDNMTLTREQLSEIQDDLQNDTDIAILELLFYGVGGKSLKELTFLQKEQVSLNEMCVYFKTGKKLLLNDRQYMILERAFRETELMSYNLGSEKITQVRSLGIYKVRSNTRSLSDDYNDPACIERRYRWCQRRIDLLKKYLDLPITAESIQNSGFLHHIKLGMEKTKLPFELFISTDDCKKICRKYDVHSDLFPQIVKTKFEHYFK